MTDIRSGQTAAAIVTCLIAVAAAAPAAGQTAPDVRTWTAVSVQGRVAPDSPWRWASDSQVRTRDTAGTLDFLAERVMVSREISRRSSVGVGYAYGAGFLDAGSLREHRLVQQYAWSGGGVGRRLSLKTRLEERFVTSQDAMLIRVRQQVRVTWPVLSRQGLSGSVRGRGSTGDPSDQRRAWLHERSLAQFVGGESQQPRSVRHSDGGTVTALETRRASNEEGGNTRETRFGPPSHRAQR